MIAAILLILVTAMATCHGQTQYWQLDVTYARTDCTGVPVKFAAINTTADPSSCRDVPCFVANMIGGRVRKCYNGSEPLSSVIPTDIDCSACSYCRSDTFEDATCGPLGQTPYLMGLRLLNACHPSGGGGYYYILDGCTRTGLEVFSKAYSDDRCTVLLFSNTPTSGPACVESSPYCSAGSPFSSLYSCHYATATRTPAGNTTNNQTSSGTRPAFGFIGVGTLGASLFLLVILVFVCI